MPYGVNYNGNVNGGYNNRGYNQTPPHLQTALYVDLVRTADANRDQVLTRNELDSFTTMLTNQKQALEDAIDTYGSDYRLAQLFRAVQDRIDVYIEGGKRMRDNFLAFARPNSGDTDEEVTVADVYAAGFKDFTPGDVTDRDLGAPKPTPTDINRYLQFAAQADRGTGETRESDGKLSKAEITAQLERYNSVLTTLKERIATIPPQFYQLFAQQIDLIEEEILVGQRMSNRFDALDKGNTAGTLDGNIVAEEILFAARRDNNQAHITDADLLIT